MTGSTSRVQTLGGPALFVLLWSTGFVGARYGLPYAEPFTFLSLRLGVAAALLGVLAVALRSAGMAFRREYGRASVAGLLLHGGYLGGVFYAISLGVPAGVSAVIVSLQPVLTAVLAARVLGERPTARQWLGLALGVGGVVLVVGPGIAVAGPAEPLPVAGLVACLVALASGTVGTVYQKRHGDRIPLVWGTAVQYAAAAAVVLAGAVATEDMSIRWTGEFIIAFVWLVLFLSIGAVLLQLLLLRRGTAAGVSSLYYLVPVATSVEAYLLFGERLSGPSLVGIGVSALGVALMMAPTGER
ncbi:DMT family transporter [Geodermatophilus sabuli]|uniref:Threonine/homoserine efflux transporter RhtA n=1 Tax=Geodermatophilus sabuli TaxID=1564158 RepID=A0A285EA65_9ACTN|nr:DMT family transporter [Geodermatophilus sabuli]MBB3085550.1 drug/metabolite transporter (DMT)-like permease [Geodermatophilus sabuli]SNX96028.1 Threonine/homoserine efflux transporter RhtA [Geodermatophilus sabuli]